MCEPNKACLEAIIQKLEKIENKQSLQRLHTTLLAIWSIGSVIAIWCRLLC